MQRIVAYMKPPASRWVWSVPLRIAGMTCLAVYAYWATGLRPFTVACYVAVGIPVAFVTLAFVVVDARELSDDRRQQVFGVHGAVPWMVGALLAAGLEGLGLALGGRSTAVPTLSTVIDHALSWHVLRLVLFCAWLVVGSVLFISVMRRRRRVS